MTSKHLETFYLALSDLSCIRFDKLQSILQDIFEVQTTPADLDRLSKQIPATFRRNIGGNWYYFDVSPDNCAQILQQIRDGFETPPPPPQANGNVGRAIATAKATANAASGTQRNDGNVKPTPKAVVKAKAKGDLSVKTAQKVRPNTQHEAQDKQPIQPPPTKESQPRKALSRGTTEDAVDRDSEPQRKPPTRSDSLDIGKGEVGARAQPHQESTKVTASPDPRSVLQPTDSAQTVKPSSTEKLGPLYKELNTSTTDTLPDQPVTQVRESHQSDPKVSLTGAQRDTLLQSAPSEPSEPATPSKRAPLGGVKSASSKAPLIRDGSKVNESISKNRDGQAKITHESETLSKAEIIPGLERRDCHSTMDHTSLISSGKPSESERESKGYQAETNSVKAISRGPDIGVRPSASYGPERMLEGAHGTIAPNQDPINQDPIQSSTRLIYRKVENDQNAVGRLAERDMTTGSSTTRASWNRSAGPTTVEDREQAGFRLQPPVFRAPERQAPGSEVMTRQSEQNERPPHDWAFSEISVRRTTQTQSSTRVPDSQSSMYQGWDRRTESTVSRFNNDEKPPGYSSKERSQGNGRVFDPLAYASSEYTESEHERLYPAEPSKKERERQRKQFDRPMKNGEEEDHGPPGYDSRRLSSYSSRESVPTRGNYRRRYRESSEDRPPGYRQYSRSYSPSDASRGSYRRRSSSRSNRTDSVDRSLDRPSLHSDSNTPRSPFASARRAYRSDTESSHFSNKSEPQERRAYRPINSTNAVEDASKLYVNVIKPWGLWAIPEDRKRFCRKGIPLMEATVGSPLEIIGDDGENPSIWWLVKDPMCGRIGWFPVACCVATAGEYKNLTAQLTERLNRAVRR